MEIRRWSFYILLLTSLLWQCKSAQHVEIQYTDQNNNQYIIKENSLEYIPITELESSSGTYNGGDPAKVRISDSDVKTIAKLADELMIASEGKEVKREMLTSVLRIKKDSTSKNAILRRSDDRSELEKLLERLISQ